MSRITVLPIKTYRKFKNKPCAADGYKFDSRKERKRYGELKTLEKAGEIKDLVLQPEFPIVIAGHLICKYRADFGYTDTRNDKRIIEDVKSPATRKLPVYRLKSKLMRAVLGIEVLEV